jgi:hypothetical protein
LAGGRVKGQKECRGESIRIRDILPLGRERHGVKTVKG